ncbi:intraflagellar transport protein 74 homolog [Orussus abietinus]|uniref:intraflagellar transport protein 74 homolog n=1 Tax=Orussus abietinus TaxID=222816 RepID=UPI000625EB6A|nr:intraflagellar transport protein 74 homolog [Orussus abietinus]
MDSNRPMTGKSNERPVTRWGRDQDESGGPQNRTRRPSTGVERPQSKLERPTSRRGTKNEINEYGDGMHSAAPSQNSVPRPPSASIFSSRSLTANSRANLMSSGTGLGRLNTGLSTTSQMNVNILDRPITQQGIAGIRPGTNRGLPMNRQVQDKRYYEGLVQLKIRELTQEIASISREIDSQSRDRLTLMHYDKRAKDLAAELSDLQGQLADYNIVVDKMSMDIDKEVVERDTRELRQLNDRTSSEIERMFEHRQQKEQELRNLEKSIELERRNTERIVESMEQGIRDKYDGLIKEKTRLQGAVDKIQQELDELSKQKSTMEEQIALSQVKQEAVKLHVKILETEEKVEKLRAEERNKLTPEEEREHLLSKVKQDNTDIAAAERQIADAKKRTVELEQELEQLETELEESQSEKQIKYKELRKREEVMEQFMSTFERTKKEELEKLEKLEATVVERLEAISNNIDGEAYLTLGEETALLNLQPTQEYQVLSADQNLESLGKEHARLQQVLIKMESMEKRLKTELMNLNEKIKKQQSELVTLEDLDGLKARYEMKREKLLAEKEELRASEPSCIKKLKAVEEEHMVIKERLNKNETYRQISSLEGKLEKLKQDNKSMEEFIGEERNRANYAPLKDHTFNLVARCNHVLMDIMKPVY